MNLLRTIKLSEFLPYFFIGAAATLIDWFIFWIFITRVGISYEIALTISFLIAAVLHFFANKTITFQCRSKQIFSQFFIYLSVSIISLLFSIGIMFFLINILTLSNLLGRVTTTGLMLVPNYLLHKYITFGKKFKETAII